MNGEQALSRLERRLGLHAVTDERYTPLVLFDALTESRDKLVRAFAQGAPILVQDTATLVVQGGDHRRYDIPTAALDPYRILQVRSYTNKIPMRASMTADDAGEYWWNTIRELEIPDGFTPTGGVEIVYVPSFAAITKDTDEADMGLPTTCHMAMVKGAVMEVLSTDDEVDISGPLAQFSMELGDLENLYAEYDAMGGTGLREAFLAAYGQWLGDMVY